MKTHMFNRSGEDTTGEVSVQLNSMGRQPDMSQTDEVSSSVRFLKAKKKIETHLFYLVHICLEVRRPQ
jgi:hypothetical protein